MRWLNIHENKLNTFANPVLFPPSKVIMAVIEIVAANRAWDSWKSRIAEDAAFAKRVCDMRS